MNLILGIIIIPSNSMPKQQVDSLQESKLQRQSEDSYKIIKTRLFKTSANREHRTYHGNYGQLYATNFKNLKDLSQNDMIIQKQFNVALNFINWSQQEDLSFAEFQLRICQEITIQQQQLKIILQNAYFDNQVRIICRRLQQEIRRNIKKYQATNQSLLKYMKTRNQSSFPHLSQKASIENNQENLLQQFITLYKNVNILQSEEKYEQYSQQTGQKSQIVNKMLILQRTAQPRQQVIQAFLLFMHYISSNLGSYATILEYISNKKIQKKVEQYIEIYHKPKDLSKLQKYNLLTKDLNKQQQSTKDRDKCTQIYLIPAKILTIICLIRLKFHQTIEQQLKITNVLTKTINYRLNAEYQCYPTTDKPEFITANKSNNRFQTCMKCQQKKCREHLDGISKLSSKSIINSLNADKLCQIKSKQSQEIIMGSTTLFLCYKSIQILCKPLLTEISCTSKPNVYDILTKILFYHKICKWYKEKQQQKKQMKNSDNYKISGFDNQQSYTKSDNKSKVQQLKSFMHLLNDFQAILSTFKDSLWKHAQKQTIEEELYDQSYDANEINGEVKINQKNMNANKGKLLSQDSSKNKSGRKYSYKYKNQKTNQRSLSMQIKLRYEDSAENLKKDMEELFFKDSRQIVENSKKKSRSAFFSPQDNANRILNNNFFNAKNALKMIDLQLKTGEQKKEKFRQKLSKKKPLTKEARKAIYAKFQNNKRLIISIPIANLQKQIKGLENFYFYDPKQQIKQIKHGVIDYRINFSADNPISPNSQQEQTNIKTIEKQEEVIKIIKYIDGKPKIVGIRIKLLENNYLIKISLKLDGNYFQNKIDISLPKSCNIFTGRFETIWPTMNYLFRKKILQYWIFSQNEEHFSFSKQPLLGQRKDLGKGPLLQEKRIMNIFGLISEEQFEQISQAMCLLGKFIDIILVKKITPTGKRYSIKQIFNERISNICITPIMSRRNKKYSFEYVIEQIRKRKNIHPALLSMKQSVFLLGDQEIILGVSLLKQTRQAKILKRDLTSPLSSYKSIRLTTNSKNFIALLYENKQIELKLYIEPLNCQNLHQKNKSLKKQKFQTFNVSLDIARDLRIRQKNIAQLANGSDDTINIRQQTSSDHVQSQKQQQKSSDKFEHIIRIPYKQFQLLLKSHYFSVLDYIYYLKYLTHPDCCCQRKLQFNNLIYPKLMKICLMKLQLMDSFESYTFKADQFWQGSKNYYGSTGSIQKERKTMKVNVIQNCFNFQFDDMNKPKPSVHEALIKSDQSSRVKKDKSQHFKHTSYLLKPFRRNHENKINNLKMPIMINLCQRDMPNNSSVRANKRLVKFLSTSTISRQSAKKNKDKDQKNEKQKKPVTNKRPKLDKIYQYGPTMSVQIEVQKKSANQYQTHIRSQQIVKILCHYSKHQQIHSLFATISDIQFICDIHALLNHTNTQKNQNIKSYYNLTGILRDSIVISRAKIIPKPMIYLNGDKYCQYFYSNCGMLKGGKSKFHGTYGRQVFSNEEIVSICQGISMKQSMGAQSLRAQEINEISVTFSKENKIIKQEQEEKESNQEQQSSSSSSSSSVSSCSSVSQKQQPEKVINIDFQKLISNLQILVPWKQFNHIKYIAIKPSKLFPSKAKLPVNNSKIRKIFSTKFSAPYYMLALRIVGITENYRCDHTPQESRAMITTSNLFAQVEISIPGNQCLLFCRLKIQSLMNILIPSLFSAKQKEQFYHSIFCLITDTQKLSCKDHSHQSVQSKLKQFLGNINVQKVLMRQIEVSIMQQMQLEHVRYVGMYHSECLGDWKVRIVQFVSQEELVGYEVVLHSTTFINKVFQYQYNLSQSSRKIESELDQNLNCAFSFDLGIHIEEKYIEKDDYFELNKIFFGSANKACRKKRFSHEYQQPLVTTVSRTQISQVMRLYRLEEESVLWGTANKVTLKQLAKFYVNHCCKSKDGVNNQDFCNHSASICLNN